MLVHAFGSTGGAEDQVSWPRKANRLVATSSRAGSDAREAVKDKVTQVQRCRVPGRGPWADPNCVPRDLAPRATSAVKSLGIVPGASYRAWRTTWSVLTEASFSSPSLQGLQKSGQTRTKTTSGLLKCFEYNFTVYLYYFCYSWSSAIGRVFCSTVLCKSLQAKLNFKKCMTFHGLLFKIGLFFLSKFFLKIPAFQNPFPFGIFTKIKFSWEMFISMSLVRWHKLSIKCSNFKMSWRNVEKNNTWRLETVN